MNITLLKKRTFELIAISPAIQLIRRLSGHLAHRHMKILKQLIFIIPLLLATSSAVAAVTLTSTSTTVTLDNGTIEATWTKDDGNMTSLKLNGAELIDSADGGRSYMSIGINGNSPGDLSGSTYSLIQDTNAIKEISFKRSADTTWPIDIDLRFVLRDGDSGVYTYLVYEHDSTMADVEMTQNRFGVRIDPDTFTRVHLEQERYKDEPSPSDLDWADNNEPSPALEPHEAKLLADESVYYKYDNTGNVIDGDVYGWTGAGKGFWFIRPSLEYYCSGPAKQHILAHQTPTTPFLMNHMSDTHFGSTGTFLTSADGTWSKIAGPIFIYANDGIDHDELWTDAVNQTATEKSNWPYTWMTHSEYPTIRGTVTGNLDIDGLLEDGAMAVLAAPNEGSVPHWHYQAKDYIFWSQVDANGDFSIENARPGNYWLYIYSDEVAEEHVVKNVSVTANSTTPLGTINWTPVDFGNELWKIGSYNRNGSEFFKGDDHPVWGQWMDFPDDFPNGVNYTIGTSDPATDWNYAHVNVDDNGTLIAPTWTINFDLASAPTEEQMVLRIPYAAMNQTTSIINVNGVEVDRVSGMVSDSGVIRASTRGMYQNQIVKFPSSLLRAGTNKITLDASSGAYSKALIYDALELVERTTQNHDVGIWHMEAITDPISGGDKGGYIRDDDAGDEGRSNHLHAPGFKKNVDAPSVTTSNGGQVGEALILDGIDDAAMRTNAWHGVAGGVSLDLWYKADVGETDGTIIEADDKWELALNDGNLEFSLLESITVDEITTTNKTTTASIDSLSTDTWYHVVVTYNADTHVIDLTANTSSITVTAATAMVRGNAAITIGRRYDDDGEGYFAGLVDEVKLAVLPSSSTPFGITTADGTGVDDDVVEADPDNNSGTDRTTLELYSRNITGSIRHKVPFLRFDISTLKAGTSVRDAKLSWYHENTSSGFDVDIFGVNNGVTGEDNWSASGLTYNSAPGFTSADVPIDPDRDHTTSDLTYLGTVTVEGVGTHFLSSSALDAFINADTNDAVTFILEMPEPLSGESFNNKISSAESTIAKQRPKLSGYTLVTTAVTTADGNGADDDVIEDLPDNNSGIDRTYMTLRSRNITATRHTVPFLRFDTSSFASETITGAELFWNHEDTASGFNVDVFGVNDGVTGEDDWTPAGLTYNSAPGFNTANYPNIDRNHVTNNVTYLGTVAVTGSSAHMLSTPALDAFLKADTNDKVTFILEPEVAPIGVNYKNNISSAENATESNRPTLNVYTEQ